MNICYLSYSIIPSLMANSVQVMHMSEAFAELGHNVTLYTKRSELTDDPFYFYGIKPIFQLRYLPKKKAGKISKKLFGWRVRLPTDLIYARCLIALRKSKPKGIPFIIEAHTLPHPSEELNSFYEDFFTWPNFKRLILISNTLKEDFIARFASLDQSKILIAPDGATPMPPNLLLQSRLTERLQIGYVGHLYPGRGIELIFALAARCAWADFHIVGGRQEELKYWRSQPPPGPNMILHGFVPHRETMSYLATFDILIAPYQTAVTAHGGIETSRWMSPLKIFEYMSHGKPIITSDLQVLREVLQNERNALLVSPADIEAWLGAIIRLRDNPVLRQQLGQRALQDFTANYSWLSRARRVLAGLKLS